MKLLVALLAATSFTLFAQEAAPAAATEEVAQTEAPADVAPAAEKCGCRK